MSPHPISQPVGGCHTLHAPPSYQESLLTAADRRTIEVRGQLTDREHLDALRLVQRRLGNSWIVPAVFLGGPALIVVLNLMAGESLARAVFRNLFWIPFGLLYFIGLPLAARFHLRSWLKANPALGASQLYRFTETGFDSRGGPLEVSIAWPSITEAVETKAVFLLFTGRTMAQIIPRGAITAAGQLEAVRGLLRERLGERAHLLPAREQRGTPVRDGGT